MCVGRGGVGGGGRRSVGGGRRFREGGLVVERGVRVQCCFTSAETIRTVRDGEPRTSTSTFTLLLSSVTSMLLYVHRDHIKDY